MDTPSSGAESYLAAQQDKRMRGPALDDSDSDSETATPGIPQTLISKQLADSDSDSESESEEEAEPVQPAKVAETPASGIVSGSEVSSPDVTKMAAPKVAESDSESGSETESEDEATSRVPKEHETVQIPSEFGEKTESPDNQSAKYEEEVKTFIIKFILKHQVSYVELNKQTKKPKIVNIFLSINFNQNMCCGCSGP